MCISIPYPWSGRYDGIDEEEYKSKIEEALARKRVQVKEIEEMLLQIKNKNYNFMPEAPDYRRLEYRLGIYQKRLDKIFSLFQYPVKDEAIFQ